MKERQHKRWATISFIFMKEAKEYLDKLKTERKYSDHTIKSYLVDFEEYFAFLEKENLNYLDIEYSDIRFYLMQLNDEGNSSATVSRKISSLRGFYKYLSKEKRIKINPFVLIKLPKKEKKLPRFFYYNELEELFAEPRLNTTLGQRNRLILELLYASGIRVSELVEIKIGDFQGDRTIKVLGKGNKERIVRYGEYAEEILNIYLNDAYNVLNKNKLDYLFLNNRGNKLTTRGVRYILDKIIEKTSIEKKISPHMLRHSFATHLINEGCDILSVKELLGHESLSATSVYTHVSNARLRDVYFKTHPRAKKK